MRGFPKACARWSDPRARGGQSSSAGADGEVLVLHERIDLERGEALWRHRADVEALVAKRFGRLPPAMHPHEGPDGVGAHVDGAAVRATLDVARAAGGSLPVEYSYTARSEGFGRMFAKVAAELPAGSGARLLPCVYMPREVRASLSDRDYVDVDFANCQPTLLRQRLGVCGIGCPLLARYIDARDAGLAEVAAAMHVDRDAAKQLFVRIVYGGGIEGWARDHGVDSLAAMPAWVRDLAAELRASTSALVALPELEDLRDYHARVHVCASASQPSANARSTGSVVAIHLQSLEAECVRALVAVARATRREVGSIIHDGMHVRREPGDPPGRLPDGLLERWSAHVLGTTGFLAVSGGQAVRGARLRHRRRRAGRWRRRHHGRCPGRRRRVVEGWRPAARLRGHEAPLGALRVQCRGQRQLLRLRDGQRRGQGAPHLRRADAARLEASPALLRRRAGQGRRRRRQARAPPLHHALDRRPVHPRVQQHRAVPAPGPDAGRLLQHLEPVRDRMHRCIGPASRRSATTRPRGPWRSSSTSCTCCAAATRP